MPLKSKIKTRFVDKVAASRGPINRLKATGFGLKTPELELYYEAGDPHSHLAAQVLRQQQDTINAPLRIRMVGEADAATYPEADKQRHMALVDAQRIAPALGLEFPSAARLPSPNARELAGHQLQAISHDLHAWLALEAELAPKLFGGAELTDAEANPACAAALAHNQQRRSRLGHYLPGMWQYNGDWFWGVDRLQHLEKALQAKGAFAQGQHLLNCDVSRYALPQIQNLDAPLEFFFSFRSPYSYLAATTLLQQLQHLPVELEVRPVLPMAMRGMKIPKAKGFYIVRDVYREAQRLGYPFGHIADPIGAGAQRCLQVFPLAQDVEQQLRFCQQAAQAIWSEAVDVATDSGLQLVCERSGIRWADALDRIESNADLLYAETNREALFAAGAWGVPTFRISNFVCWGNDRMPMLGELLRRHFS